MRPFLWATAAGLLISTGLAFAELTGAAEAVSLAASGRCAEAMPKLDAAMRDAAVPEQEKRQVSTAGVRCSMLLNQQPDAMSFLAWLQQHYPSDPEVLFLAAHVFSELSDRNAQELMRSSPDSPFVIQLNAEAFEKEHDLNKAIAEYRILLKRSPDLPGIHYRIGGLLMTSSPSAQSNEDAKREFEAELKVNPHNAAAEYYLGELESRAGNSAQAATHYRKAIENYPDFADALGALGRALLDSGATEEAARNLERAVKLAPDNPAFHLALGRAYQRMGRKDDAAKEFALQKSTSEAINEQTKLLRKTVSGVDATQTQLP